LPGDPLESSLSRTFSKLWDAVSIVARKPQGRR
jgi:hypothetical protein